MSTFRNAKALLALSMLAAAARAQSTASVKITLTAAGTVNTSQDPILFFAPGTVAPFGPGLIIAALWITPETYTTGNPFNIEIDVENIGAGGNYINTSAPLFKSFGTGSITFPAGKTAVAKGTVEIQEGTEQFSQPSGSIEFTLTYDLNPAVEQAQTTFDAAGTVTSNGLQEIINQYGLVPSVKKIVTSIVSNSSTPKTMSIGLWTGTQAVVWSASTSTDSSGNSLQVSPSSGTAAPVSATNLTVTANGSGQSPGVYQGGVTVNGNTSPPTQGQSRNAKADQSGSFSFTVPVTMVVTSGDQLLVSQSGVQLQAVGGVAPAAQPVAISSTGSSPLEFSTVISTLSGGSWLTVTPGSGSTASSSSGNATTVQIGADITGLAPGVYFGRVDFTAPDATNSTQSVEVALNILENAATPIVQPAGLVFVGAAGSTPAAQTIAVIDATGGPSDIAAAPVYEQGSNWFSVSPSGNALVPGKPLTLTVTPTTAGLAAGLYAGSISLQTANLTTIYDLPVVMVLTAAGSGTSGAASPRAACGPTQLIPVVTNLPDGFEAMAGLPVPLQVEVIDDCGNPLNDGWVAVSTGAADPDVFLTSTGNGQWTGTWLPHETAGGPASVAVNASSFTPALQGSATVSGTLAANSSAPLINTGGVLSSASWTPNAPIGPGGFISILGSNLATGSTVASTLPLPTMMGGTRVLMGGEALPLQYTGSGQINALAPYDVAVNSTQQVIVEQNGVAYSLPETVVVAAAQPAVFTQNQSGSGPGAILVVKTNGDQFLNTAATPASSGDALEIFCTGLGAVSPAVPAGSAAPSSPPAQTLNPVSVQIGGQSVTPFFAGLAPGYAGLYQVNVIVPSGLTAGPAVPVVLSVSGASSAPVTIAVE